MWDEFSSAPEKALEWQNQYLRFMFELEDASGDGAIDVDEFTSVCSCYGLDVPECREAFQKMAQVKTRLSGHVQVVHNKVPRTRISETMRDINEV